MIPGEKIGPYELIEVEDANEQIWLGQAEDGRLVHVRRIIADEAGIPAVGAGGVDDEAVSRFEAEIALAQALRHPNLVRCVDGGHWGHQFYVVTDFVEGLRLPRLVEGVYRLGKVLPPWCVGYIVRNVAVALRHVRDFEGPQGEVLTFSRPLLPSEVMVTRTGGIKLVACPRAASVHAADEAPDALFDLGVIFWELLCNRSLRTALETEPRKRALRRDEVPALPETIPAPLAEVALRCLARVGEGCIDGWDELIEVLDAGLNRHLEEPESELRRVVAHASASLGLRPVPTVRFEGEDAEVAEAEAQNLINHPRFEVLARLGSGGMGEVYRVRDRELDEIVALKVLPGSEPSEWRSLDRLRREVRLARRIASDHICRIFDIVDLGDGARGMTMALIDGLTLFDLMKSGLAMSYGRFVQWGIDIADGLAAAHRLAIVHRDLKPENVMIRDEDDRAVILDFGIARTRSEADVDPRLTQRGVVVGTPLYMSPEQLCNGSLDGRSDLYALGLIMTQLITGRIPHATGDFAELVRRRAFEPTPDPFDIRQTAPGVPDGLAEIVNRMLAHMPEDRPESAEVVRDALRGLDVDQLTSAPVPASYAMGELQPDLRPGEQTASDWRGVPNRSRRRSSKERPPPRSSGPRWLWVLIGLLLAAVSTGVLVVMFQRKPVDDRDGRAKAPTAAREASSVSVPKGSPGVIVAPDAGQRRPDAGSSSRRRRRKPQPLPEPEEM